MQKLTYINLLGEQIELSGSPPYILSHVEGLGATVPDIITTRGVYQNGVTTHRMLRQKRTVKAGVTLYGARTREEMYAQRAELQKRLALERCFDHVSGNMGRIIYENDKGRWWAYAVPSTPPGDGTRVTTHLKDINITFQCNSAYWTSFEQNVQTLRMGNGGFKLPFSFPIRFGLSLFDGLCVNNGSGNAYVVIEIHGSGEMPSVENKTTGAVLRVNRPIVTGEILTINTDPEALSVSITDASGNVSNAFGYLDSALAVTGFYLVPGRNEIRYIPSMANAASVMVVRWETRLGGV